MSYEVYDRDADAKDDLQNAGNPDGSEIICQSWTLNWSLDTSYCLVNARITQKYTAEKANATARMNALESISFP